MTPPKGLPVFLDTNVFLRHNIVETPEHVAVRAAIERLINDECILWISWQVVREFAVVLTRPQTFAKPLTTTEVAAQLKRLLPLFQVANETARVAANLLTLMEQHPMGGKQIHDANIVATMQAYGITHLFTLNPADFVRFSELITVITLEELPKKDSG